MMSGFIRGRAGNKLRSKPYKITTRNSRLAVDAKYYKMLIHIVCWKYKQETTAEERALHIARLQSLPDEIPNILSFKVGSDVLGLERSFDTGLVAAYPDRDALDFYTDHPLHREAAAFGKQIAEKVVSVDFFDD